MLNFRPVSHTVLSDVAVTVCVTVNTGLVEAIVPQSSFADWPGSVLRPPRAGGGTDVS